MEKSVFYITDSLINQKQGLPATNIRDSDGTFVVKLPGLKLKTIVKIKNYL